jgi:hypothetical protein
MQSVLDAFSVEEVDSTRKIAESVQFAWKKNLISSIRLFTIGVSRIGGTDLIAGPSGANTNWTRYQYTDESAYLLSLDYERGLNLPEGGLVKALADMRLDNTSGRFNPRYAGGNSEIFTAVNKPSRPFVINAGFNYGGIDNTIPQFVGTTSKAPRIDSRNRTADFAGEDFIGYIQNSYVDKTEMFTSEFTDVLIARGLAELGFSTAQYDLDPGINRVNFGLFETGSKWGDYVDQLVKAENGHLYQDETGVVRFDNRQKWSQFPYFNVQRVISTGQVINQVLPEADHIINVVEITASPREVQDSQLIWQAVAYAGTGVITLPAGNTEVWASYNDPVFEVDTPIPSTVYSQTSYYVANTLADGTGTTATSSVTLKSITNFAQSSKLVFTNSSSSPVFLTTLDIWGRPARKTGDIYYKEKRDSSVTAYGEQILKISNDYIQDSSWAQSLAGIILNDFAVPENLQELTIRAMPELQLGDLISWQGRYWRVYDIKTKIDPGYGFIQDIKLLQRTITSYFRIGVSLIGGTDRISP